MISIRKHYPPETKYRRCHGKVLNNEDIAYRLVSYRKPRLDKMQKRSLENIYIQNKHMVSSNTGNPQNHKLCNLNRHLSMWGRVLNIVHIPNHPLKWESVLTEQHIKSVDKGLTHQIVINTEYTQYTY